MVHNVFIEKKIDKVCAKTTNLCNTEVSVFSIFHYTVVIQASIVTSQIHYQILEFYCVLCKVNCMFKWNETEKFCFISLYTLMAGLQIYRTWIST